MALEPMTLTEAQIRRQFQRGLQTLMDTFHDVMLSYTQNIQVVNFSDVYIDLVHIIIMYDTSEGWSVN